MDYPDYIIFRIILYYVLSDPGKPRPPDPRGKGDAHLHGKCTTRQAHTHTRACETALALLSSPISDMLSHLTYPGRCHTPTRSSASCGSKGR